MLKSKVDLSKLQGAVVANLGKAKKKCLVIPIEDARVFHSEKTGAVYLDLVHFENRNGVDDYGNTHSIKQSLKKEDQKEQEPFLGSSKDEGGARTNQAAATPSAALEMADDDDLPF